MICAPIIETSIEDAIKTANKVSSDLVEIRLDFLENPETIDLGKLDEIEKPVIATCMPTWEGGRYDGREEDRIAILSEAIDHTDYVSIELNTEEILRKTIIEKALEKGKLSIVSYHDHEKTPGQEEIIDILRRERESCADISKIAFYARDYMDVHRVMTVLLENRDKPLIAISMGEPGKVLRALAPLYGAYLTFAAVEKGRESAPGQLSVDEVRAVLDLIGPKCSRPSP